MNFDDDDDFEWGEEYPLEGDAFPHLRAALAPEYADLDDDEIAGLVEELHDGVSAEDLENFFRSIGRVARRVLPGVVSGATTGAALGPYGALAGALIGGATSALSGGGRRRGRGRGRRRVRRARPAARRRGRPSRARRVRRRGFRGGSSARFASLLGRPEVQRALGSMVLGRLLEDIEEEQHEFALDSSAEASEFAPDYLIEDGELVADPADADARAEALLELFEQTAEDEFEAIEAMDMPYVEEVVLLGEGAADELEADDDLDEADHGDLPSLLADYEDALEGPS